MSAKEEDLLESRNPNCDGWVADPAIETRTLIRRILPQEVPVVSVRIAVFGHPTSPRQESMIAFHVSTSRARETKNEMMMLTRKGITEDSIN
jgi:hypothetical protein